MSEAFFDALETRDPAQREAALMAALPAQIEHAQSSSPAYTELLAGIDAAAITSRAALAQLPLTRKSSLAAAQAARRALRLGGYAAGMPRRIFQSPGPLYEPEPDADGADPWRVARALHAAGIRTGQLAHVSFSYHLTPAGAMMEAGLRALGAASFPGGVGNTELQLQALLDLQPEAYAGTPSFLRILLEKAAEGGHALPYLIPDFWTATVLAIIVVVVELAAISWIRHRYMEKGKSDIVAVAPAMAEFSPAFAYKQYGVPYHPGALKFYKERNLSPRPLE